jgi:hypothetical protein
MSQVSVEELADTMYDYVVEMKGKKNVKAMDLIKAMIDKYGEDTVDKKLCKQAIRTLMDSGRCQYSYAGGSYIVPAQ